MNHPSSSFQSLSLDPEITSYFIENNIDVISFVKRYIQVDKLLHSSVSNEIATDHILQLKSAISQQAAHISQLQQQLESFSSTFSTSLKDFTNNDIKNFLLDHLQSIKNILSSSSSSTPSHLTDLLSNFQEKLVNLNTQQLNDLDRKSLNMLSNFQSNLLKDISTTLDSHTIHHKITTINDTLTTLHNNFTGNSSQKGKMTENMLYTNLLKAFPDSDVISTRDTPNSGDIHISREGRPLILIDSKHCESSNVRKSDLDKFYSDCQLHNSCGILCNSFGGIANRRHFEIDIQENRVYVFLSNHQFDPHLFQVATQIIYNVYDVIKEQPTDMIEMQPELFQQLKIEYNYFLQSFVEHIEAMRSNLNSLSQLSLQNLGHFFKRTTLKTDKKSFYCIKCGTGFGSQRACNKHLKEKHDIVVNNPRGRPKKTSDEASSDGDD